MSIADDIRAAADRLWESGFQISATHLRAHAATIERVEKEMREAFPWAEAQKLADALRGDAT